MFTKTQKNLGKVARDLNEERLGACVPVAHKLIELLLNTEFTIGEMNEKRKVDAYAGTAKRVLELLVAEGVKYRDVGFVFQLAFQAFEGVRDMTDLSVRRSFDKAEALLWKKDFGGLTLGDIDRVLKA